MPSHNDSEKLVFQVCQKRFFLILNDCVTYCYVGYVGALCTKLIEIGLSFWFFKGSKHWLIQQ